MAKIAINNSFEVVINRCYGGFMLSMEAMKIFAEQKGWSLKPYHIESQNPSTVEYFKNDPYYNVFIDQQGKEIELEDVPRNDPVLVSVVKLLGKKASGPHSDLRIYEVTIAIDHIIKEYDGMEQIDNSFDYEEVLLIDR